MPPFALMPALALLLAAPQVCPPQEGQIRWDGFSIKLGAYELRGTIWDRDVSGAPSKGDLVRIDETLRNGRSTGLDAQWFLLGPALGGEFGKRFGAVKDSLQQACESRVEIGKDMPTYASVEALTRQLNAATGPATPQSSPEDDLRAEMSTWADEICKQSKHVAEKDLEGMLVTRAGSRKGISKPVVRGVAHEVAAKFAFACTRVEGKFTFDK